MKIDFTKHISQKTVIFLFSFILIFLEGSVVKTSAATPGEIQQWLDAHNNLRGLHGVPNVTWSDSVAASAQEWADTCPSGHSGSDYGENLAYATYIMSLQSAVLMWYKEEPYYDYNNPGFSLETAHFTQVVWKNTTQIGCGFKTGCLGEDVWPNVWVCQYNPPGNYLTQFADNVFPPGSGISLGEALDNTSLQFTTGGDSDWYGQRVDAYSGGDAARSGTILEDQSTWLQTSVTGPASLEFYWKVSSEADDDFLAFYIDGAEQPGKISGEADWARKGYSIGNGSHVLKWMYSKDNLFSEGLDAAWVDKILIKYPEPGSFLPAITLPLLLKEKVGK